MFGLGGMEIVVILIVALVVLGPEKMPQVAKQLARALGEFKRGTDQVRQHVEDATQEQRPEPAPERRSEGAAEQAKTEAAEAAPQEVDDTRPEKQVPHA